MSTKPSSPELRPNRYDALVVLVVLALAAALAVRPFLAARAPQSGALTVVVSADDCPGQDCVHSGAVSRAGQSIVCLPARIVVELVGAADGYDLVTG